MVYSTVDVVGGSGTGTSATVTSGDAATGDAVFLHIVWEGTGVTSITDNDWVIIDEVKTGPDYMSGLYAHVLDGTDTITVSWTGSTGFTWQLIACDGLTATPVASAEIASAQTNSAATLPRLQAVEATDHVLCFAGAVNLLSKDNTRAYTDVGFVTAEGTEANTGQPTLWVGQFGGPVGDLTETFPASVYFDPPPTHSIGYTVAVNVA